MMNILVISPLGDKDNFDWRSEKGMGFEALAKILEIKELTGETIGVAMTLVKRYAQYIFDEYQHRGKPLL